MFHQFVLIALAGVFLFGILKYYKKYKHMIKVTKNIPSPPCWPIIGHAYLFIGKPAHQLPLILAELMGKYGKTLKIWLGPELNIMTCDVNDAEVILSSMTLLDKASEYEVLEPWLREGLLISRGKKWHQRRKVITPAFHFKILDQFIETFEKESRSLIKNFREEMKIEQPSGMNLYSWINLCTLDIICETSMGVNINAQSNANSEYVCAVKTIARVLHKRMFDLFYRFDSIYRFTLLAVEAEKALNILHDFTEKVIVQRREELLKAKDKDENVKPELNDVGAKRRMAFLDILLQSEIDGKPLSNRDIREEVDTFMFEGHDTTSSALVFFLYNIAIHQECQRRCYEEIISIMGNDQTKPVTSDDLSKMRYVELCIKETLRMFPSVPLVGRKVIQECEINGKIFPAGTNIGVSPFLLGHSADIFDEPEAFKPERFDVVLSAEKMNPYASIPFSAGPRNCIGQKFAVLEIKTIVANVLRNFMIFYAGNPMEEPLLIAELVLRTKDPLMFHLKSRV